MIKLFLTDIDGTLTNGIYHMGEDGSLSKGFYSRDFHGLAELNKTGVRIGIISYSRDRVIYQQCERAAKYALVMTGHRDKKKAIEERFIKSHAGITGLDWSEIAYIGDDTVDLGLLRAVGLAGCPSDAHDLVRTAVEDGGFVSSYAGGSGAVRDFTEYVLQVNDQYQPEVS